MNVSPEGLTPNNIAVSFDENVTRTSKTPQSIAKVLTPQNSIISGASSTKDKNTVMYKGLTIPRPDFSDETSASSSRTLIPFQADSTIPVTNISALQCHKDLSIQPDKFQNKRPKKHNIRIMPNETLARTQGRLAWNALIVDGDGQNGKLDLNDSSVNNNTRQSVYETLNKC
ncbi:uncharacterized protein G2W53_004180 [Senna tora]|uniref:Uncharacterized protein n=1 Tax=Senna tora TaxID=362788 RepID=A0A834XCE2_9FABA|nr:uncharacterized protein G2W53_004180 [Senna tora]